LLLSQLYSYFLWPAATKVVALRPHQLFQTSFELRSQGSTLHGPILLPFRHCLDLG
jgi:hypothetical protein